MLRNTTIAPKLGKLVGATLIGLCAASGIAIYLMQQEMFNARVDQAKAIVSMAKNISAQVEAMQQSTNDAVTAIDGISQTIAQMSEITTSIASSIEQQGEATREIARNIQSAAAGSSEISTHIGGVTTAAEATGTAASQVLDNARELDNQSGMLRSAVDGFLAKVRAA